MRLNCKENVFIHIPRAGGSSINRIFRFNNINVIKHNIASSKHYFLYQYKEQFFYMKHRKKRFSRAKRYLLKNKQDNFLIRIVRVLPSLMLIFGPPKRNPIFSFTFVRNPWDRAVSAFFYLNQGGVNSDDELDRKRYISKFNGNFRLFVLSSFNDHRIFQQAHFRPQSEWICDHSGNILVDYIGKIEDYQNCFNRVCEIMKIKPQIIPHLNKSSHKSYTTYYDKKTKQIIEKAYEKDIKMFDYDFYPIARGYDSN